jgi:DNA-binding CsgD family transcriptional regulator
MFDRPQLYHFEDFVRDTSRATGDETLFALLSRAVAQYGYDQLMFSVLFDRALPTELNRPCLFTTYPEDWMKDYVEKDCARIDPVLRAAGTTGYAFTWEDLEKTTIYTPQQVRFMRMAEDAGLNAGIGVPVRGSRALVAGIGLAASDRHDGAAAHLDLLNAICTQFYLAFKRLHMRPEASTADVTSLSPKEREILSWVAAGKTDDEIGIILSISRNTVDTHMRNIFRKLDAPNRVAAAVKGITLGHIHP